MTPPIPVPSRHVYPPGAPRHGAFREDRGGLGDRERKGLLRLRTVESGEVEQRETLPDEDGLMLFRNREVFDFYDQDTRMRFLLDVRGIKDAIAEERVSYVVGEAELTLDSYFILLERGGIEESHLARITKRDLEIPVIYVQWPDGSLVLIDGVHRVVKQFRAGRPAVRCVILTFRAAQRFFLDLSRTEMFNAAGERIPFVAPLPPIAPKASL